MARRRTRSTAQDSADDPRLQDDSPELWNAEFAEVPRALLTSAVRCFAAKGFHATTTRDISEGAGLSPAALYVHFSSKELVLFEIIRMAHERVLAYIQEPAAATIAHSGDQLHTIVSRYTEWHARHHVAARVSQYELAGLTAEHYQEVLELRHQTTELFRATVARGVADGSFAQLDVKRVTRAILSLSIDLVRWYRLEGSDSPTELGEFNADLALKLVSHQGAVPTQDGHPPRSAALTRPSPATG